MFSIKPKMIYILYFIIFIEGFYTLSLELLVMRQVVPFVGSGTEIISIIISSVLLPLSLGYYFGGNRISNKKNKSVRNILISNIFIIVTLTGIGFSYYSLELFYFLMPDGNLLLVLTAHLIMFLVIPTFLLGQTVPLITNYFPKKNMTKTTGVILFLSTLGSFIGSLSIVLVFMRYFGVSISLILIELLLLSLIVILSKQKIKDTFKISFIIAILISLYSLGEKSFHIIYSNNYSTVSVYEDLNETKQLVINRSFASRTDSDNKNFYPYVNQINNLLSHEQNKSILIVGAGGFTIGFNDSKNNYLYLDVDPNLLSVVESSFLKTELHNNQTFKVREVRRFLLNNPTLKFDVIIVDAYSNRISIPKELLTSNFYGMLKEHITPNGFIISNILSDIFMQTKFSRNIDRTIRSVFEDTAIIQVLNKDITSELSIGNAKVINKLYILRTSPEIVRNIYTDDKNNYNFDKKR